MERQKSVIMAEVMTPNMANFTGNVHGGYLLSFLDRVAYACATRYCGYNVVTLSVDQVVFKEPIHVGELVTCMAMVNYVGTTSMEIGMKVLAENVKTGEVRHTNTCYFTMVAVDENVKPVAVSPLKLTDPIEKRSLAEAKLRRERRLKFRQEHLERKSNEE